MNSRMNPRQQAAHDAIDAVFSDTTNPRSKTRDMLEELAADIEMKLEALDDGETEYEPEDFEEDED